jgi:hypothetical protein
VTPPLRRLVVDLGRQARAGRTPTVPEGFEALDRLVRDMADALANIGPGMVVGVGKIMAGYDEALRALVEAEQEAARQAAAEEAGR